VTSHYFCFFYQPTKYRLVNEKKHGLAFSKIKIYSILYTVRDIGDMISVNFVFCFFPPFFLISKFGVKRLVKNLAKKIGDIFFSNHCKEFTESVV